MRVAVAVAVIVAVAVDVAVAVGVGVRVAIAVAVAVGVGVWVAVGVAVLVAVGLAVAVGVGVGVGPDCAQYFPPLFKSTGPVPRPPQTIISLPDQIAVWRYRAAGALLILVAVQLSMPGLYLPPVFKYPGLVPPQTIISVAVQTAV